MDALELWLSFVGSWLLFTGAVYQSSLELKDEEFERGRVAAVQALQNIPPSPSPYWWFLPPVRLYLEYRRSQKYGRDFFNALSPEDMQAIISYKSKSNGWLLVAGGTWLLAISETNQLFSEHHIHKLLLWLTVVGLTILGILYTVLTNAHAEKTKELTKK
jgi:hypothetical protein